MPDLIAIGQGLNALKGATDIVKALVSLRDSAKLLETTVELNQKILAVQEALANAQAEQASLVETIRQREEEIARLKTWDREKRRYELTEVVPGCFAYVIKPAARRSEPTHWLCPACYQKGEKSILQGFSSSLKGWVHTCPNCNLELETGPHKT